MKPARLATFAALLAAAPPMAALADDSPVGTVTHVPAPRHAASIEVLGATYGLRRSTLVCPALQTAIRLCQGKAQCAIPAADTDCAAGDKVPSVLIATLSVQYRCFPGDIERTMAQERPFVLHISCLGFTR